MTPFELVEQIQAARFRRMQFEDTIIAAAYQIVRALVGKKAGSLKKFMGRDLAGVWKRKFLDRRTPQEQKFIMDLRSMIQRVKDADSTRRAKGHPRG